MYVGVDEVTLHIGIMIHLAVKVHLYDLELWLLELVIRTTISFE